MSNKICPSCKTKNDSGNLKCIKCSDNLIYVPNEPEWTAEQEKMRFDRNYFLEEFLSPSLFIRIAIVFFIAFFLRFFLNPLTLTIVIIVITIIIVGSYFLPKEEDYFNPVELLSLIFKKITKGK